MAGILTESITFSTMKSLSEIASIIRNAANQLCANIEKIGINDPLAQFDDNKADIEVALTGEWSALSWSEKRKFTRLNCAQDIWCVQIYVTDFGDKREVEMVSLGSKTNLFYSDGIHTELSRAYRDKIADMLI